MKAIVTALCFLFLSTIGFAHEVKHGDLVIEHPWLVHDNTGEDLAYGYFKIVNAGEADRLMNAATYEAVSATIQKIEKTSALTQNIVTLPEGVAIPAGETVEFAPGTYRVLLKDLRRRFQPGEMVEIVLTFEKAKFVQLMFEVTE